MNQYFLIGLVAALLLISIVQALQINEIKGQITGKAVSSVSEPSQSQQSAPQQQQPAAPSKPSQPSMVGGC